MDTDHLISLLCAAAAGIFGIIKFKLIEELMKKIMPDNKNVKAYSVILLIVLVIGLGLFGPNFFDTAFSAPGADEATKAQVPVESTPPPKSDLEVKVEAAKQGVELTKDLVKAAKGNKHRKDSIFEASKFERWVFQINDWTDDDDRIIEIYKSLSMTDNVKLLKIKKQYLFIKDDQMSKQELALSLDSMRETLPSLQLKPFNLNEVTTRKRDKLVERIETFGKRKNKVKIPCLILD